MAPEPGHLLSTTDDERALLMADRHTAVTAARGPEGALVVTGTQRQVSAYVGSLVRVDIDLIAYTPTETPLEALFFMLTDDAAHVSADESTSSLQEAVR